MVQGTPGSAVDRAAAAASKRRRRGGGRRSAEPASVRRAGEESGAGERGAGQRTQESRPLHERSFARGMELREPSDDDDG